MRHSTFACALLVLFVSVSLPALAQEAGSSRPLYIIFDGSNSMWGELPDTSRKIEVAKDVFRGLDASLFRNRDVALRIYGHRRAGDCSDTEPAVLFGAAEGALSTMVDRIDGVTPRGKTPITRSLQAAKEDLGIAKATSCSSRTASRPATQTPVTWSRTGTMPVSTFACTWSGSV